MSLLYILHFLFFIFIGRIHSYFDTHHNRTVSVDRQGPEDGLIGYVRNMSSSKINVKTW
jgi:hypothetical protein